MYSGDKIKLDNYLKTHDEIDIKDKQWILDLVRFDDYNKKQIFDIKIFKNSLGVNKYIKKLSGKWWYNHITGETRKRKININSTHFHRVQNGNELVMYLMTHNTLDIKDKDYIKSKICKKIKYLNDKMDQIDDIYIENQKYCIEIGWDKLYIDKRLCKYINNQILHSALRHMIFETNKKIKTKIIKKCSKCEMCGSEEKLTLDHIYKFRDIATNFIKNENIKTNVRPFEYYLMTGKIETEFKKKWIKYHNNIVTYRVLCDECNKKVG